MSFERKVDWVKLNSFNLQFKIDYAFFLPREKRHNSGKIGFLCAACPATFAIAVVPFKNRKMESFQEAVRYLCGSGVFPVIESLVSDREAAVYSQRFMNQIKADYGINIRYMSKGSKSFIAELAISKVKKGLSTICSAQNNPADRKKWTAFVDPFVIYHNNKHAYGTSFKRSEINDSNFLEYLDERLGVSDSTTAFNSSSIDLRSLSDEMAAALFRYFPGESVLLARKALSIVDETGKKDGSAFTKASVIGSFSNIEYRISSCKLKLTRDQKLVPGKFSKGRPPAFSFTSFVLFFSVYTLISAGANKPVRGQFYTNELAPYPARSK